MKLVFCLRRLPHLSREEFQRYWREVHAPLVASHAPVLGIARYVQSHTGHDEFAVGLAADRGAPEPFDGVAELWFGREPGSPRYTPEELQRSQAALLEDERRFIDLAASPIFYADSHQFVPGPP